ncbi:hypothetical protein [Lentibacillus sp. Marseille-P4043]|uniref:hypothetical protein n=1 Tax=Lentibacillus sp. Marseille-P4043 TaxID=2040293 RepID=UPI000D0B7FAC|nr:hypothetical protein [Lentibacillus sp. Marseille-P4043]
MRKIKQPIPIVFLLVIIIISGCSTKSEEDAINDAKEAAQQAFRAEEIEIIPNQQLNNFSLYVPDHLVIDEESKSNVILKDGDQTYIVFYNDLETLKSQLNFQSVQRDDALLNESFEDDDKFGYIHVLPDEGDGYEMQVGIGGVKITTYTSKDKMDSDALELMKMARSIGIPADPEEK